MADISLFNRYHGKENTITNYCGLMLKLLYQYSPSKFEECINNLAPSEDINNNLEQSEQQLIVEPEFKQQNAYKEKGSKKSVLDLKISQKAFSVLFEVKTSDWFYDEQFKKYIKNIIPKKGEVVFFFALSSEFNSDDKFKKISEGMNEEGIIFHAITFESLLSNLKSVEKEVNNLVYSKFLKEFETFLENESLLPKWKYLLDVVNCANSIEQVEKGFYSCPNTGGSYNHRRAKYFAPYKNKRVKSVYEIECVVVVKNSAKEPEIDSIEYNNTDISENKINERVKDYFNKFSDKVEGFDPQIFLLSEKSETDFIKKSPGGLFGSKKYFWGISRNLTNNSREELAKFLRGREWEEFD